VDQVEAAPGESVSAQVHALHIEIRLVEPVEQRR
jgi:hypothetical protein